MREMTKRIASPVSPRTESMKRMYRRAVANWAFDLLAHRPAAVWPDCDAEADHTDRDWRKLYAGDILDD